MSKQETITPIRGIEDAKKVHFHGPSPYDFTSRTMPALIKSHLEKAQLVASPSFAPSKPTLLPPENPKEKRTLRESFVSIVDKLHETTTETLELDNARVDNLTSRMIAQQQKRVEKLHEAAKEATKRETWSVLKMVASSLVGAAAIIAGIVACGTMNPGGIAAGSLLIASGIGSISSTVLSYRGYDPKMTGALGLCSAGLSLIGGGISYFVLAHQLPQLLTTILNSTVGVAEGMSLFGKEYAGMLLANINAELAKINLALSSEGIKLQQIGESSQETGSLIEIEGQASHALSNYQRAIKEINLTAAHAV